MEGKPGKIWRYASCVEWRELTSLAQKRAKDLKKTEDVVSCVVIDLLSFVFLLLPRLLVRNLHL